ncbi:hypothetical protein [Bradyrhizobium japonicum]|uniref:hypothetical protein n=1 Tax=Bradyrhizobium japonicum TaxID=375 RepID=UPI001B8A64C3|nr:hypothetical protein [Bradyrhizobium japonicum]
MEIVDNLETLHREEERLRGEHQKLVVSKEDLGDHIHIIREAMNMIWALLHEYQHKSEDELTMQFLGIRLFNTAAGSIKLAYSGYYQGAFSSLRDFLETFFLIDYLGTHPEQISSWSSATQRELRGKYGPNAIRSALDARDSFKEGKRKELYDLISHHATHATPSGFKMTTNDMLGEIGPFYRELNFEAWMGEAAKMVCNAGIVFAASFKAVDERILTTKAVYLEHLNIWKKKYFGGADVWKT